jgi:hypothetical protein
VIVRSVSESVTFVEVASKLRRDASARQNGKEVLRPPDSRTAALVDSR